jgi:hypothetical protein
MREMHEIKKSYGKVQIDTVSNETDGSIHIWIFNTKNKIVANFTVIKDDDVGLNIF